LPYHVIAILAAILEGGRGIEAQGGPSRAKEIKYKLTAVAFRVKFTVQNKLPKLTTNICTCSMLIM